jgi:hypothetical protein
VTLSMWGIVRVAAASIGCTAALVGVSGAVRARRRARALRLRGRAGSSHGKPFRHPSRRLCGR